MNNSEVEPVAAASFLALEVVHPSVAADPAPEFVPSANNYVLPLRSPPPIQESHAFIVSHAVAIPDQTFSTG